MKEARQDGEFPAALLPHEPQGLLGRSRRLPPGIQPARSGCCRRVRGWGLLLVGLLLLYPGLPAASSVTHRIRCIESNGSTFLYMRDIASYYGMQFSPAGKRVTLHSQWSRLVFDVDRRESSINNVGVHLSEAPWISNGQPLLAEPDFRLVLDPILRSKVLKRGSIRRILIDPGHGGRDPGAIGRHHQEKTITLQVAKRLGSALKSRGYTVALTRTGDVTVSLSSRARKARIWNADIMVSLHCNAVGADKVHGVEIFRGTPTGGKSTYGTRKATVACTNNAWDSDNTRLAYELQRSIVKATGAPDRGVKNARFLVLRECPCPAVLVEMGFLSHRTEERQLASAAYQVKMVDGLVNGILNYSSSLQGP